MTKIGLLSDTHGSLPAKTFGFFKDCDQIWHAGDFGDIKIIEQLQASKPVKAVFGNIDGTEARALFKETLVFKVEDVKVVMMHIGGYPGRYSWQARETIQKERPGLFISGHSHILKVMYDKKHKLLHINPGAAGKFGLHQKITLVRFAIDGDEIKDLEIFEKER
ncbi:MAG: YfcE family phosphodiesterase [Bacteroidetes bacterium 4484_276]|nr:MAG: YfcE family phosphodiesterase [Bacteroidetes bacterium 4484_276]OYT14352.1 MAG: YfcE family phosphodiesterase [Bacteroidetes bacterium 4572_114]